MSQSSFERDLLAELRRIRTALERVAESLAGKRDDPEPPPGIAETLTVLTNVAMDAVGLPDMPESPEQPEKPS